LYTGSITSEARAVEANGRVPATTVEMTAARRTRCENVNLMMDSF
jgi:hypothetical protein